MDDYTDNRAHGFAVAKQLLKMENDYMWGFQVMMRKLGTTDTDNYRLVPLSRIKHEEDTFKLTLTVLGEEYSREYFKIVAKAG